MVNISGEMSIFVTIFSGIFAMFFAYGCSCNCECDGSADDSSRGSLTPIRERQQMKVPNAVLQEKFYKLLMTMDSKYHPPLWIPRHDLGRYWGLVVVYYGSTFAAAKNLAYKKEPCRLDGVRKYNLEKMEKYFKYRESDISDKTTEVIGTYILTPVKIPGKTDIDFFDIKIFSIAWPHFEDEGSPEYSLAKEMDSQNDLVRFLEDYFHHLFSKLSRCFLRERISKMVFTDLRIEESIKYAREKFNLDYVAIMNRIFQHYFRPPAAINFYSVGETHLPIGGQFDKSLIDMVLQMKDSDELQTTLFVNSATAVGLLGNGNVMDNSSNGMFGRMTAISVLGWAVTNPKIQYEFVAPDTPGHQFINELD